MIDNEYVVKLIKDIGFPIVVCCAMAWFIFDSQEKINQSYKLREDRLLKQIESFNVTLNDFNKTLQSIDKRIGVLEHGKR